MDFPALSTQKRRSSFSFSQKVCACLLAVSLLGFYYIPSDVFAATGDITAVRITDDARGEGWAAEIDIDGLSTGGTYNFNLGTNNVPTANTPYFTVTSQGFDDSGNLTTITRKVYATNYERKVYPDNAVANETDNSGSVTVRVALSDWVYSDDTLTFTAPAAFYTQGGHSNSATSAMAVTNNSEETYPKVIANWSYPGYSRIAGSTFQLHAVAFHRSAQQGRPVRAVTFVCTDQHSNSASDTVTSPTIDSSLGDTVPVVEYIGTISTASLTNGDTLTCNFQAYPWYGDSSSVVDTSDGVNSMPTPLYAPQYYLLDKDNTYGVTVAVVDATAGNNSTGAAVDAGAFNATDDNATTHPFLNIYAAANAIAAYNNTNHSRNDTGAGIIYLKEGSYAWTGGTVSAGGLAESVPWLTVTKFPGATRANVLISSASGTKRINQHLKIKDVKITNTTTQGFTGMKALWVDNSDFASTGSATVYINTVNYFTDSQFYNDNELQLFTATLNSPRALVRGNKSMTTLSGKTLLGYTVLGNNFSWTGGGKITDAVSSQGSPTNSGPIYAFNILSKTSASSGLIGAGQTAESGLAVIQNVLELVSGTTPPEVSIVADSSSVDPVSNVLFWNNTVVGQRFNGAYNDYNLNGSGPGWRRNWSFRGNIFDNFNVVTDIDAHGGTPDATRYGNHSLTHGVSSTGNAFLERTGTFGGFLPKFIGLNSISGSSLNPYYVNDQSVLGGGAGGGDYHLTESSPALSLVAANEAVLPYDISGIARYDNGTGSAGAYEFVIDEETPTPTPSPSPTETPTPTPTPSPTPSPTPTPTPTPPAAAVPIAFLTGQNVSANNTNTQHNASHPSGTLITYMGD
ncbi:MAG TPA: hypothetical protein VG866_00680, partial [Candidatus Paceibacterota bacterium]|nr:hypothetical protein [Candidatus Paceibacterota bacterium]